MKFATFTIAAFLACASFATATPCETLMANKKSALAFLDGLFNKRDVAVIDLYVGATYAQHNPTVPDGRDTLIAGAPALANTTKVEFGEAVASGDLVWVNTRYSGFSTMPTSVGVDVFRFENGKIVEHWDILQTEVPVEKAVSGRPMFPIRGIMPRGPHACDGSA